MTGLVTERQRIQHLLRRAAFGYSSAELEEYLALGLDGTIERLLAPELVDDTTAEVARTEAQAVVQLQLRLLGQYPTKTRDPSKSVSALPERCRGENHPMTTEAKSQSTDTTEYQGTLAGYHLRLLLRLANKPGTLGRVTTLIGEHGADVHDIDITEADSDHILRQLSIFCPDENTANTLVAALTNIDDVEVQHASDLTFQLHRHGKIEIQNTVGEGTTVSLRLPLVPS